MVQVFSRIEVLCGKCMNPKFKKCCMAIWVLIFILLGIVYASVEGEAVVNEPDVVAR